MSPTSTDPRLPAFEEAVAALPDSQRENVRAMLAKGDLSPWRLFCAGYDAYKGELEAARKVYEASPNRIGLERLTEIFKDAPDDVEVSGAMPPPKATHQGTDIPFLLEMVRCMAGADDVKSLTFTPEQVQQFTGLVAGRCADIVADLRKAHNTMGNQCGRECEFIEGWYDAENAIRRAFSLPETELPEIQHGA
jgi:hypothetical protein